MISNYDDIHRMHRHHKLPIGDKPALLNGSEQLFRENFLSEELLEFQDASRQKDLPGAADALIDLVVVALGTAIMMGLPWQPLWTDVFRANMAKKRVTSTRAQGGYDLAKPEGWRPPETTTILKKFRRGTPDPAYSAKPGVVTLCGSTKFKDEFQYWDRHFTLRGFVVLSVGFFSHADGEMVSATAKAKLDQLHLHKIDMSDRVFVINPGGYIGESTAAEIAYAEGRDVEIWYLERLEDE